MSFTTSAATAFEAGAGGVHASDSAALRGSEDEAEVEVVHDGGELSHIQTLDAAAAAEVIAAAEALRKETEDRTVHVRGWRIMWVLRRKSSGGDLSAIDPADGKRVYSVRALRRKLAVTTFDEEVEREAEEAARRNKRHMESEALLLPQGQSRRTRKAVSYADIPRKRARDEILEVLHTEGAIAPKDCSPDLAPSDQICSGGLELPTLADRITQLGVNRYQTIRAPLQKLLTSGHVRRRRVVPSRSTHMDTEETLQLLLISSLQIEADDRAPWSLPPLQITLSADAAACGVGGGRGSGHLAALTFGSARPPPCHMRGRSLVGRRVEIWWDGDAEFHQAIVVDYVEPPDCALAQQHTARAAEGVAACDTDPEAAALAEKGRTNEQGNAENASNMSDAPCVDHPLRQLSSLIPLHVHIVQYCADGCARLPRSPASQPSACMCVDCTPTAQHTSDIIAVTAAESPQSLRVGYAPWKT